VEITLNYLKYGSQEFICGFAHDITERKQMEKELINFREKMSRTERLSTLGTISATVAHEINQPLTVIRMLLQNTLEELKSCEISAAAMDYIKDSLAEVDRASLMLHRFRGYFHLPEMGKNDIIDLWKIPSRIVNLLMEPAHWAKLNLVLDDDVNDVMVRLNYAVDMEQIFFILIENAIQAAKGNSWHALTISGSVEKDKIELRFSDNCCGIKPENLDKIFDPFFTTKPRTQATGVGLCIVRRILEDVGGNIRVESQLGQGTTFFITLPVKLHGDI